MIVRAATSAGARGEEQEEDEAPECGRFGAGSWRADWRALWETPPLPIPLMFCENMHDAGGSEKLFPANKLHRVATSGFGALVHSPRGPPEAAVLRQQLLFKRLAQKPPTLLRVVAAAEACCSHNCREAISFQLAITSASRPNCPELGSARPHSRKPQPPSCRRSVAVSRASVALANINSRTASGRTTGWHVALAGAQCRRSA